MTYNPYLAKVKVDLPTKYQGHRSNSSAVRALSLTDRRTDATKYMYIISLASRSITMIFKMIFKTFKTHKAPNGAHEIIRRVTNSIKSAVGKLTAHV